MKKIFKHFIALSLVFALLFSLVGCDFKSLLGGETTGGSNDTQKELKPYTVTYVTDYEKIKNVIFIIGDGMGDVQLDAGELAYDKEYTFRDTFSAISSETNSLDPDTNEATETTDSAAAATALATGVLTYNKRISMDSNFNEFTTFLDLAKSVGKSTAVVTTDYLSGATPAGFSAHTLARSLEIEIIKSQITSGVDLLIGQYDETYDKYEKQIKEKYNYVKTYDKEAILASKESDALCLFNIEKSTNDSIELKDATDLAINYLADDQDGFVLVIEQAHIDKKCSDNDFEAAAKASNSLNDTVEYVLNFASQRDDTAVIVTADHETGGLKVSSNPEEYENTSTSLNGTVFSYEFSTTNHTQTPVPFYFYGFGAKPERFTTYSSKEKLKNNEIFFIVKDLVMHSQMVEE